MTRRDKLIDITEWLLIIAAIISICKGEPLLALVFLVLSDTTVIRFKLRRFNKDEKKID